MSESNRLFARWSALKKEVTVKDGCGMRVLDLGPGAIPRGRLVCVLGPSGCGKTSLLSILGLVDHEFEGDLGVELGGRFQPIGQWRGRKRQRESARLRRHIGFVFQEMRLRAGASAVENVMDPMLYLGFGTPRTRYSHAKSMLGLFGLQDRDIERPISCFSGGMQQRTGLARALSIGPDLIIADEPTAHVDDKMANAIYEDLKRRSAERGITVVVATHNEEMADKHADHIIRFKPKFQDEEEVRRAKDLGEWPYDLIVEREAEGIEPADAKGETPKRASTLGSFKDMAVVALGEGYPLVRVTGRGIRALGWGWAAALVNRLRKKPSVRRERIAPHRYLPLLVSIVTFGLLAGMGFSLYGIKSAILAYQQSKLESLESLRRVRVFDPGDLEGGAIRLDVADVEKFAAEHGVKITESVPVHDLGGEALIPSEMAHLASEGQWAPVQSSALLDPSSIDDRERNANRIFFTILGTFPNEPQARDQGLPAEPSGFAPKDDTAPAVWIPRNEWEWLYGNFEALPEPGDSVGVMFMGIARMERTPEAQGDVIPPAVCVRFNIGGYLNPPRLPSGFVSEVQAKYYKAVVSKDVVKRILEWQNDPLNPAKALPDAWRCEGSPSIYPDWQYTVKDEVRAPAATQFDFFAPTPSDALKLERILEDYSSDRGLTFGRVSSERGFIQQVSRLIKLAEYVGLVLHVLPIAVGGVILWLVVHEILFRRREDLLLFHVMGAPTINLHVQSLVLSMLVVLPGILIGYIIGSAGPGLMVGVMSNETLPPDLLEHLAKVGIGWVGLLQTTLAAVICAVFASFTVVKSILSSNPASAFRGMQ